jgi:ribonuclease P protein component
LNSARISELLTTSPKATKNWGLYLGACEKNTSGDLGIAVAKKLVKRAVDRNKLKRFLRERIRKPSSALLETHDAVVRLKKPIGKGTRGRLRAAELNALKQELSGLI